MKIIKGLLFFFFISLAGKMNAQDIHFTQFYLSPLTTNPAYTGAFEGTFRIGGILREQWGSVIDNSFGTQDFYIDAPILMLGKRHWLGVGGMFLNDGAGSLDLGMSQAMGSAAVHLAMDKKSQNVLTIGLQGGYFSRSLDITNAEFNEEETNFRGNPEQGVHSTNYFDINAGILLKSQMNEKMRLELGAAINHLLTPDYYLNEGNGGGAGGGQDAQNLPANFLLHGQFFIGVTEKIEVKPAFLFQSLSGANEIMIQGLMGYHLNKEKQITLDFGVGYRLRDATKFIVGMNYKQFRAGAAYDLTVSGVRDASSAAGGFELGVSYIAKIFKKPNVKPVIFCPRF